MTDRELLELLVKKVTEMDSRISNIETNMATKQDMQEISRKIDTVYEHVAGLTEYKTVTAKKISNLAIDVKLLKIAVAD